MASVTSASAASGGDVVLSLEQAKDAVQSIVKELDSDVVQCAFDDARTDAGSDGNKLMELVLPLLFEIQGRILETLGFIPNDDGFAAFADQLKRHEGDASFDVLSLQLKARMKDATTVREEHD